MDLSDDRRAERDTPVGYDQEEALHRKKTIYSPSQPTKLPRYSTWCDRN